MKLPDHLEEVIQRTCDVDTHVRQAAYAVLTEKVSLSLVPPRACIDLLLRGLKDSDRAVFDAVVKLLKIWYQEMNYEIIGVCLLLAFDIDSSHAVS